VRFVFGGKAHPADGQGKEILKNLQQISKQPRFKNKLIFIPNYNWRMTRYLVSGSDVWINSPVKYQEACGTSGIKAGANGVLGFSTYDGWVDEVKSRDIFWEIADVLDSNQYYSQIENVIAPMYWRRNEVDLPLEWIERMKRTLKIVLSSYGSNRMLRDYLEKLYRPLIKDNEI